MLTTPVWQAGLGDHLRQEDRVKRRLGRRLEHDGAAGEQRRTSFPTIRNCGMFHGTIAATTPVGSLRT